MKKKLELVIDKILMRKFPQIISVRRIVDFNEVLGSASRFENAFDIEFETSSHLGRRKIADICEELTTLFKMLSPVQSSSAIGCPSIDCSFYLDGIKYDEGRIKLFGCK